MIKVFGHLAPDTDATGSALIWAWYQTQLGRPARAYILGQTNTETVFVLKYWGWACPPLLSSIAPQERVIIVDTNNPDELPENINQAQIIEIIDHHLLVGGLHTRQPIAITLRPFACCASVMADLMGDRLDTAPRSIKGLMLSCILSDTLKFTSPTTTVNDKTLGHRLAVDLSLDIDSYANEMFAAKSNTAHLSAIELLRLDSKKYQIGGKKFLISVLETTDSAQILARKAELLSAMPLVMVEDSLDRVLLFVVDIFAQQAIFLIYDSMVATLAEKSFGVKVNIGVDTVVLPGVVSRKKQIIPNLRLE